MWNVGGLQNGPYGAPSPGFHPPGGPPPSVPGYNPSYVPPLGPPFVGGPGGFQALQGPPPQGYGPPPGPPPGHFHGPPPGPPPQSGYPGQQARSQFYPGYQSPPPPPGVYSPPLPQPWQGGGFATPQPPYQPPQQFQGYQNFAPPPGPPPMPPTQQQFYGPQMQGGMQPFFQYSQCNGTKKALCIGINYFGQSAELSGCINDAKNMKRFLCTHYGYKDDDFVMLTDDSKNPLEIPNKQNILNAIRWLVQGAKPNDSLFFHFSGHGGQTEDLDGDEADGYDEVIYPVDFETNGHIVDDLLHDMMVKTLPPGCRLTAIFDCCHSGSALDLPYMYSTEGKLKEPNLAAEAGQGLLTAAVSYARGDMGSVFKSVSTLIKTTTNSQRAEKISKATKTSPADAISFSGCKDTQTSADTQEGGSATGAMSYAFISALSKNKQQSYQQLLCSVREILRGKYSQKPQLAASHPIDTNLLFVC